MSRVGVAVPESTNSHYRQDLQHAAQQNQARTQHNARSTHRSFQAPQLGQHAQHPQHQLLPAEYHPLDQAAAYNEAMSKSRMGFDPSMSFANPYGQPAQQQQQQNHLEQTTMPMQPPQPQTVQPVMDDPNQQQQQMTPIQVSAAPPPKKSRTNTPWTPGEEQRLKQMREANNSWAEIAKTFPNRTEGSVKKHWYKDMHYAEFAEDESQALMNAIKEYEQNKWKAIGAKLGKPAKACEQYAKEHFGNNVTK